MAIAGRLLNLVRQIPGATRFAKRGGKEIIQGSVPGALATSVMSTVTTGNPLAGVAVGLTDLASSSLLARGLGSQTLQNQLMKAEAAKIPLAGRIGQALPGKMVGGQYMMSIPQQAATALGSVGSAIALEPHFYPKQEAAILAQQYPQLGGMPIDQSQMATQAQQLAQLKQQNKLGQEGNSPGTLYQLQGMPMATDPSIDPYGLSRGQI